ncbi:multidrug ABC transporter ATP-binding protein [Rheinheimera sp. SA_1]|uniref:ABC transporter ATP-binding protein n=1 Tax=Rheinheimera sp. SA_1 TaxID=1827365 RepID=UPI0008022D19|nr:ABC transporter ATP-binding protein [Rheinheimera sp. SA_1]OBP15052.1 multidrug ABC transporter ATP-binding protein [Rheinheimera sp. SA_1]
MLRFFEKLTNPFPAAEPQQPPRGLLAFCLHYSKGMGWPLLVMATLTALIAMLEVSLFGFMGQLVDWLIEKDPKTLWQTEGKTLLTMGLLTAVGIPALILLHAAVIHQTILGNYPMAIRWSAHRYLLKQSISFYQNDFAGRIATKVMQTALAVRETATKLLDVMVYVLVYFSTMLYLIADADLLLVTPLLVWLGLYIALQCYFVPRLKDVATRQADARSEMTGRIVDSYTNINTIKLFSHTSREAEYAKDSMSQFLQPVYQQMRLVTWLTFSVQTLNYLLVFAIGAMSIWLWTEQAVSIGSIAIAVSLALRLNGMSQWIMWEVSGLFENIGTVVDGITTLAQPQLVQDVPDAKQLAVSGGAITFADLKFNYGKVFGNDSSHTNKAPVLDGLQLQIKPGEKVGLVGRSGAGKSTLVNLLLRFYDLEQGKILIDGQDISQVQQESLRAQIAMVTQDTSLLHRSVRENVLYGKPDASEAELLAAIKAAEADTFIADLTDPKGKSGLDAQVGERGVKLSGGQRQRIAIARVLLKNAPILILDEATSALDSEVEAAIQQSLNTLMAGKTVIAIAHRLSTIAAMDRLIVLDQGRIVEEGTHQQLIAAGGIYAQLWAHQTGGFIGLD